MEEMGARRGRLGEFLMKISLGAEERVSSSSCLWQCQTRQKRGRGLPSPSKDEPFSSFCLNFNLPPQKAPGERRKREFFKEVEEKNFFTFFPPPLQKRLRRFSIPLLSPVQPFYLLPALGHFPAVVELFPSFSACL